VRFALFGEDALEAHERVLARLSAEEDEVVADT
jgi:hypothetical protein